MRAPEGGGGAALLTPSRRRQCRVPLPVGNAGTRLPSRTPVRHCSEGGRRSSIPSWATTLGVLHSHAERVFVVRNLVHPARPLPRMRVHARFTRGGSQFFFGARGRRSIVRQTLKSDLANPPTLGRCTFLREAFRRAAAGSADRVSLSSEARDPCRLVSAFFSRLPALLWEMHSFAVSLAARLTPKQIRAQRVLKAFSQGSSQWRGPVSRRL